MKKSINTTEIKSQLARLFDQMNVLAETMLTTTASINDKLNRILNKDTDDPDDDFPEKYDDDLDPWEGWIIMVTELQQLEDEEREVPHYFAGLLTRGKGQNKPYWISEVENAEIFDSEKDAMMMVKKHGLGTEFYAGQGQCFPVELVKVERHYNRVTKEYDRIKLVPERSWKAQPARKGKKTQ